MREKLPIVISGYTCHVPTVVYKVKRRVPYSVMKSIVKTITKRGGKKQKMRSIKNKHKHCS